MGKCRSTRQVKTPNDCFKCVCLHRHLCWRVSSYPTSLRHFQSLPLEWSHLLLFVHRTLLFCYGIDHVLFIVTLPLHLLFGLCVCACTHSHTLFWLIDFLGFRPCFSSQKAYFDLHQLWSHIIPWAQPHCGFDFCLITVYFQVSSLLDWEPVEDRCALYFLLN